ncbi:MarR family winged helix-turn-helix transcriptional regulator [Nevskia soli]|uniref:MarR family winged helix-turn-helix transcriptional regulator n=1 Tax=Nevskia soli TaxID=418856 RepID=UPI000690FA75|nr:MarR family winged helix-turn-helix transcriptional regulator [Nevskia soli]
MNQTEFLECDDCLCFAARRAARAITQFYDRQLRESGLRSTQFTLLAFLLNAGTSSVNQAAEYLGMERTTLSRNLEPLLSAGYVRVDSGEDRRVKMIAITTKGRAAARAALPLWRQAQQAMTARLPPAAAQTLSLASRVG